MSNFLRGLVQRGAGLPLPVTLRPAADPLQQAASVPASFSMEEPHMEATRAAPLFTSSSVAAQQGSNANFAERNESISQPTAVSSPEPRPAIQSTPMPIAAASHVAPEPSADAVLPRQNSANAKSQEPLTATRIPASAGEEERAVLPRPVQGSRPAAPAQQDQSELKVMHRDEEVDSLSSRPATQREHFPVVQLPQPAPAATRILEKRTIPEPRSIQVKIGRVEIRSSQPQTVVKTVRPPSPGGFDDWKLARTYLDRSLR